MKNKAKYGVILGVLIVFFLLFGAFYDKSQKNNSNSMTYNRKVMDIKDTSSASETCADSLENFYQDDEYVYSFPCMKSSKVIVYYNDGTQDYVRNALSNKDITISDLDYYQINYVKEPISK